MSDDDELVKEGGLTHAGLADDGQVPSAVVAKSQRIHAGTETRLPMADTFGVHGTPRKSDRWF